MTDVQEFCLRWNNHQSNLVSAFHDLRQGEDFVDVTLACDGRSLQAHKVVLSACSPFFRDLLKTTPCKHPVIVLKDISYRDLVALVEFMYQGEVRVGHDGLPSFLRTAEVLRVRGLTEEASLRQKTSQSILDHSSASQNYNPDPRSTYQSQLFHYGSNVQADMPHSPSSSGLSVGNWAGTLAEVKVEEVDLDSSSVDECESDKTSLQHKEIETIPYEEDKDQTVDEENEETPQPALTLQSFARIPPIASQELNPHVSQNLNQEFASGPDERRPGLDLQVTADQENAPGRTPGRTSTSDRPRWPCPFCLRLLSSRSSVRRHIEDRHTSDTSRHPCPLCERLYRTRNSLQYHLSTAHRDREPGPRGRPRTRPRTPLTTESHLMDNEHLENSDNSRLPVNPTAGLFPLSRGPLFGLPPT